MARCAWGWRAFEHAALMAIGAIDVGMRAGQRKSGGEMIKVCAVNARRCLRRCGRGPKHGGHRKDGQGQDSGEKPRDPHKTPFLPHNQGSRAPPDPSLPGSKQSLYRHNSPPLAAKKQGGKTPWLPFIANVNQCIKRATASNIPNNILLHQYFTEAGRHMAPGAVIAKAAPVPIIAAMTADTGGGGLRRIAGPRVARRTNQPLMPPGQRETGRIIMVEPPRPPIDTVVTAGA